jgi:hypothetical protein
VTVPASSDAFACWWRPIIENAISSSSWAPWWRLVLGGCIVVVLILLVRLVPVWTGIPL